MKTASGAQLDPKRVFAVLACLAVAIYLWDSPVLWPLKLLVVMMHESGHALATLLVGGSVDRISIAGDQSGQCLSLVPTTAFAKIVVYSAGYVGSAIAGGALLLATLRFKVRRGVLFATSVWLLAMTVLYVRDLFTLAFCVGTALLVGAAAKWLPEDLVDVFNLFLAAFSALYVVFDVRDDLWRAGDHVISDATLLADVTWIPALVWAAIWTAASLGVIGLSLWIAVRPVRRARLASTRRSLTI